MAYQVIYKVSSLVSNESNDVYEADIHRGAQVGLAPVHEGGPHAERNKSLYKKNVDLNI